MKHHIKSVNNMIRNKKGMTLLELLVSVVLISVIMLFMYKLIADVRSEKKEVDKITDNVIKLNEIEAKAQDIILNYNINRLGFNPGSTQFWFAMEKNTGRSYIGSFLFEGKKITLKIDSTLPSVVSETVVWNLTDIEFERMCYELSDDKKVINYKIFFTNNNFIKIPLHNADRVYYSGTECPDEE